MATKKTDAAKETINAATSLLNDTWKKAIDEQVARLSAAHDELQRNTGRFADQYSDAIDEIARIWKAQFSYTAQLQDQWRAMALDAAKRTTELMTPPAN